METTIHTNIRQLQLQRAILLYQGDNLPPFATTHDIVAVQPGGEASTDSTTDTTGTIATPHPPAFTILPGTPLSIDTLNQIFAPFVAQPTLIPERVLSCSPRHRLWWMPASPQTVIFSNEELGRRSAVVPIPPLLFAVTANNWRVFALADNTRPTLQTRLFHAPFFNVYDSGLICAGSSQTPPLDAPPEDWEVAFFASAFTHTLDKPKTRHERGDYAFWKAMLDGEYTAFPMTLLKLQRLTVAQLLAQTGTELAREGGADHA